MKRKVILFAALFLLSLSFVIRYPLVNHESGLDSFTIHALAGSVTEHGSIAWASDGGAIFGIGPNGYPPGGPVLVAEVGYLTGLDIETAILLMSYVLGILAVVAALALGHVHFQGRTRGMFILAATVGLSPIIVNYTSWTASTRGLFLVLLIVVVLAMELGLRSSSQLQRPILYFGPAMLITSAILVFTLATSHRLFWLVVLIGVAGAIVFVLRALWWSMMRMYKGERLELVAVSGRVAIVGGAIPGLFALNFIPDWPYRGSDWLTALSGIPTLGLSGDSLILLAVVITLGARLGVPLIFAPLGVTTFTGKMRGGSAISGISIGTLALTMPFLTLGPYTYEFLSLFVLLLSAEGFIASTAWLPLSRAGIQKFLVAYLAAALLFTGYTVGFRAQNVDPSGHGNFVEEEEIEIATYYLWADPGVMVSDDGIMSIHIRAISGKATFPAESTSGLLIADGYATPNEYVAPPSGSGLDISLAFFKNYYTTDNPLADGYTYGRHPLDSAFSRQYISLGGIDSVYIVRGGDRSTLFYPGALGYAYYGVASVTAYSVP